MPFRPLTALPLSVLLRSIFLHTISASPFLLSLATRFLHNNVDKLHLDSPINPLGLLLYYTFYKHFCAGRTSDEVHKVVNELRQRRIAGTILAYAREVEVGEKHPANVDEEAQIRQWLEGTMRTLEYSSPGGFVAVKYTGAGTPALKLLSAKPPSKPSPEIADALERICSLAVERGVKLLIDAEQAVIQEGIDAWTLDLMRKFNSNRSGKAVVYNTYQMYLKASPAKLAHHLSLASKEDWILGVKLVRGAYLTSDPREFICNTKEDTDSQYNNAILNLIDGRHGARVDLVVASHNKESVRKAVIAVEEARRNGVMPASNRGGVQEIVYAQLMGMADELSFGLTKRGSSFVLHGKVEHEEKAEPVKVYKYVVWGSITECVKYLLRRAQENQAAVGRSKENVDACWAEVKYRLGLGTHGSTN
ncbi:FAD-linked oxidoreductase-like protein [Kalaharituber pfeilii]|nr:FAD-linked oxidoreductase-like protein [Kalaharituber pfeilii]